MMKILEVDMLEVMHDALVCRLAFAVNVEKDLERAMVLTACIARLEVEAAEAGREVENPLGDQLREMVEGKESEGVMGKTAEA